MKNQKRKQDFFEFKKKNNEIEEQVEKNAIEQIFAYKNNETNSYKEQATNSPSAEVDFNKMYSETFGIKNEEAKEKRKR